LAEKARGAGFIWLVAEQGGAMVGDSYSIRLPVPPIYAATLGLPGLIMDDFTVMPTAPTWHCWLRLKPRCGRRGQRHLRCTRPKWKKAQA